MTPGDQSGIGMTSQRTRDRLITRLAEQGISNLQVLDVMRHTPRHLFLDEALSHRAYEDTALPIGQNQTISQPYIVALMTQIAVGDRSDANPLGVVLEVGTGCGYQTAVLAQLANRVCTLERIRTLQVSAEQRLRELSLRNIEYRHGDGFVGWKDRAPFDAIIVTAAASEVPAMLLKQLAMGGRMVIPIGSDQQQSLRVIHKTSEECVDEEVIPVKFVPLRRGLIA
jgi:protein-L-isoaspartate(D-aspartate) O-methyltransferase